MSVMAEAHLRDALREVIDPELGCNIIDLGMVYGLVVEDEWVGVEVSMTTPGCPAQDYIVAGVRECLEALPGVSTVEVAVVWDRPWTPERMSPAAKALLGFAGVASGRARQLPSLGKWLRRTFRRWSRAGTEAPERDGA